MADVDLTIGGAIGAASNLSGRIFTHYKELDFSLTSRSSADVLQLFDIPARSFVQFVAWEVVTAEGGTLTFDIGDGSDVDGYIDGADGDTVALGALALALTEATPNTVTGYSNGKFYSAADTLDLLINNDADAAKIRVWAVILDFGV